MIRTIRTTQVIPTLFGDFYNCNIREFYSDIKFHISIKLGIIDTNGAQSLITMWNWSNHQLPRLDVKFASCFRKILQRFTIFCLNCVSWIPRRPNHLSRFFFHFQIRSSIMYPVYENLLLISNFYINKNDVFNKWRILDTRGAKNLRALALRSPWPYLNPFFPTVPTFAVRETASLRQQMLELSCENATVGTNGLILTYINKLVSSIHYAEYIYKYIYV